MPDPLPDDSASSTPGSNQPASPRPGGLSRHFRKSGDEVPADRRVESHQSAAAEAARMQEEDEIEDLTTQLRDLQAKKKTREREKRDPEDHAKRERMTRSGNLNLAVMVAPGLETTPQEVAAVLGDPVKSSSSGVAMASPLPQPAPSPNFTGPAPVYYGDSMPPQREVSSLVWILPVAALLSFGIGYLVGGRAQSPASTETAAPGAPGSTGAAAGTVESPGFWKEGNIGILDRAMALDREGDVRGAYKLANELRQSDPTLPGLTRYVAELQTRLGDFAAPELELSKEASAGRDLPQANYLRAFNLARQRRFSETFLVLQAALLKDPFSADSLYQMAELLRRQGKFADAVVVGKQALLRVRPGYGLSQETIALKLRLAQLEGGAVGEVEAAWQEAQKSPPLSGDWLLMGAALALQQKDAAKAGDLLGKARALLPKEDFENAVDDYFFRNATATGPLAEFRLTDAQRELRTARSWEFFIDP